MTYRKPYRKPTSYQPVNKAAAPMMDKRCTTCGKPSSGFGFQPKGEPLRWFCGQHKADGENYLANLG